MRAKKVQSYTAFDGDRRIASGTLIDVVRRAKEAVDRQGLCPVLIFDDLTSEVVDVDYRGAADDVVQRLMEEEENVSAACPSQPSPEIRRGPGRPRLGVVAKEVTLMPRHWAWLKSQRGGASATLRRLVEDARKRNDDGDAVRRSQEATLQFMSVMAGNLFGFEEAARSLFAGDRDRFDSFTSSWAVDIRDHVRKLSEAAFERGAGETQVEG